MKNENSVIIDKLVLLCIKYSAYLNHEDIEFADSLLWVVYNNFSFYWQRNDIVGIAAENIGREHILLPSAQKEEVEERIVYLLEEVAHLYSQLEGLGVSREEVRRLLAERQLVSRLQIKEGNVVVFVDFGVYVKLTSTQMAVFRLFLNHKDGIFVKDIAEHKNELNKLLHFYPGNMELNECRIRKTLIRLTDPTSGALNEQVSRIKSIFTKALGSEERASHYFIKSKRNCKLAIALSREFVEIL